MTLRRLVSVLLSLSVFVVLITGCEPVKLPHELPGPPGCGMRDPSKTSPGMLSMAQKTTQRLQGDPDELRDNTHGGKDWRYARNRGSVFGQQETMEVFSFNAEGLLVDQKVDIISKTGK